MLKGWQFNILFFVGVGGAIFLLLGPQLGLNVDTNPIALSGIGSILAYILTQKNSLTKKSEDKPPAKNGRHRGKDEGADASPDTSNDKEERT